MLLRLSIKFGMQGGTISSNYFFLSSTQIYYNHIYQKDISELSKKKLILI
jgi:hypothetical protein